MKSEPVKTVGELIEALKRYPAEAKVSATWESQEEEIYVCQEPSGEVVLDVDGGWYAERMSEGAGADGS